MFYKPIYISVPAGCCERLCSASVNFFEDSFNAFAHFIMGDLLEHLPTLDWAVFGPKWHDPCAPPSLFTRSHPRATFFCFPEWKKSSNVNVLLIWKRENKNGRSTKRYQNWWVQKLFLSSGKKVFIGLLHQMESTLKVTEV